MSPALRGRYRVVVLTLLSKCVWRISGDWHVCLPHPLFLEGAVWKRRQLDLYDATHPLTQPAGGAAPVMIPRRPEPRPESPGEK